MAATASAAFAAVLGLPLILASAHAEEILIHGRLAQDGPNFVVIDDQGQPTRFTEIWRQDKISRALGKDQAYWFRVLRLGKAPNYRLRLMDAYENKPLIGGEREAAVEQARQDRLQQTIDSARDEQASYRWEEGKINSSRGVWTRKDHAFTVSSNRKPGPIKTPPEVVVGRLAAAESGHFPVRPAELRPQTVTITFRDAAAAAQASLEPMPLYGGFQGVMTCRWDDSDLHSDLLVSQVGAERQVYGTCFLNGINGALCFGKKNQPDRESLHKILDFGGSIGNHSYTHPAGYTLRSRNGQFWEAMKCRAEWEALGDCLISTVAPPYNAYGDGDSIDLWLRAGHYGFINNAGRSIEKYGYSGVVCDQALMVYGTHARGEGRTLEAVRDRAGKTWAEIHQDRRIWTPNFNQYAAYRFQYEHTGIEKAVDGNTATFTLLRPALVDLDDPTPLTLTVGGVAGSAVTRVDAAGARVERLEKRPTGEALGAYTFNLGQPPDQFLPQRIGFLENETNSPNLAEVKPDADYPGLSAIACYRDGTLRVRIENHTDRPLRQVMLTYRIPLGWDKDVVRRRGMTVPAGQSLDDAIPLAIAADRYDLLRGRAWFCVQADFLHGDTPGRLHLATAYRPVDSPDPCRPAGHFLAIGPLVQTLEKAGAVADPAELGRFGNNLLEQAQKGRLSGWRMCDDGETYVADFLQVAPVASDDEHYPTERHDQVNWYLARGVLQADREQTVSVRSSATHLMVNGRPVQPRASNGRLFLTVALNKGPNEIIVAAPLAIRNITSLHGIEFIVVTKPETSDTQPAGAVRYVRP